MLDWLEEWLVAFAIATKEIKVREEKEAVACLEEANAHLEGTRVAFAEIKADLERSKA